MLAPSERAPQVPADTAQVPLEMRTKGFLVAPAAVGDEVDVTTASGRRRRGTLIAADPAYTHGFGPPVAALLTIGVELRALLAEPSS